MGYFFQISIWDGHDIVVEITSFSQREFGSLWSFHQETDNNAPFLEFAPGKRVDTWEACTDMKLYLSEGAADGAARRARSKMLASAKRARRADSNGNRRKKIQYNIIARRGRT